MNPDDLLIADVLEDNTPLEIYTSTADRVEAVEIKRVSVFCCRYVRSSEMVPTLDTTSSTPIRATDMVVNLERSEIRSQAFASFSFTNESYFFKLLATYM